MRDLCYPLVTGLCKVYPVYSLNFRKKASKTGLKGTETLIQSHVLQYMRGSMLPLTVRWMVLWSKIHLQTRWEQAPIEEESVQHNGTPEQSRTPHPGGFGTKF